MRLGGWILASTLLGCGARHDTSVPDNHGTASRGVSAGKALYERYCQLCHGEEARGYAADHASQLGNQEFLRTASDSFLMMGIDQGRPGTAMAAYGENFGGPLTVPQEQDIVRYLRSLQIEPSIAVAAAPIAGDAARGEALYLRECVACHGDAGKGYSALSVTNPVFLMTASDGFIRHAIERGRPGTPMPAFGDNLSPGELDDLTAFLRSLARNVDTTPRTGELPPTFEQAVIHPSGPDPEFPELREGRYVPALAVKDALARGAKLVLLDARPTSDWLNSHIPGALPVPYYDPLRMSQKLPRDGTWIVAYCGCPHAASGQVMDSLRKNGFPRTAVIDEGVFEWIRRGYPITYGRAQALGAPR
jgi:mono/diheme cytochrome c family protein/rhodanese-related sulfurtransferase